MKYLTLLLLTSCTYSINVVHQISPSHDTVTEMPFDIIRNEFVDVHDLWIYDDVEGAEKIKGEIKP